MGQLRTQRRNQKLYGDQWKWKHNRDATKAVLRGEFIAIQVYLKIQEKFQTT